MRVLMIISGGIAAYKSLYIIRLLKEAGVDVRCIMTQSAQQFITPLSVSALTGNQVYTDLFSLTDESEMGHIRLSREADLVLVAPATADIIARTAQGHAGDLATTALLATSAPVYLVPAMNPYMWDNPATQDNVKILKSRGVSMIGPDAGDMACGEHGAGRMVEPPQVAKTVLQVLGLDVVIDESGALQDISNTPNSHPTDSMGGDLSGRHILVTAGATIEPIDGVRYLSNYSSGKQGYAIASQLALQGAQVTLVTGKTDLDAPYGVDVIAVKTAQDMMHACDTVVKGTPSLDGAVFCAAVADWRVDNPLSSKIKKGDGGMPALNFVENPDILKTIATGKNRPTVVVGFAAETDNVVDNATQKLTAKNADLIVANRVGGDTETFGGDDNQVYFVTQKGVIDYPTQAKSDVAYHIVRFMADAILQK